MADAVYDALKGALESHKHVVGIYSKDLQIMNCSQCGAVAIAKNSGVMIVRFVEETYVDCPNFGKGVTVDTFTGDGFTITRRLQSAVDDSGATEKVKNYDVSYVVSVQYVFYEPKDKAMPVDDWKRWQTVTSGVLDYFNTEKARYGLDRSGLTSIKAVGK